MARPRQTIVSLDDTPYYHSYSRVVRKAFFEGLITQQVRTSNIEHRREWIDTRILELADIFAIDICIYALLLNKQGVNI
jgi:hypothetical protein